MGSYAQAAEHYDLLYSGFKDYEGEAARLLEILEGAVPGVRRVLDVGCGPGRHAESLSRRGLAVDGLDLEGHFVRLAQARNPGGRFRVADMTSFEVEEPYDAVLCLFGTIGYAAREAELRAAARCLADAVRPGGAVVVEPWLEPSAVTDGKVTMQSASCADLVVCRASRISVAGAVSRLDFEYLVARSSGFERLSETHELGLYSRPVMAAALEQAGLRVTYDPEGLIGRGLYVGTRV